MIRRVQRQSGMHGVQRSMVLGAVLILLVALLPSCFPSASVPDYNLYENLRIFFQARLEESDAVIREEITDVFNDTDGTDYVLTLRGLIRLVFGSPRLEVHLYSYESDAMAVASISQFEVPPNSGNFTDFAFTVRPAAKVLAPMMHGDALKGMGGSDSSFSLDFYNVNPDAIELDEFFGDQLIKIQDGLALVAPYQRQGDDRGKYIEHIKQYSSDGTYGYRIEIDESYIVDPDDEAQRKQYYEDARAAFELFVQAYFASLARVAQAPNEDAAVIKATQEGTDTFIQTLYDEDFAARLGRTLFGDDFEKYYLEGFWHDGYYGAGME